MSCAHGAGLVIGHSCSHHTAPNIADPRQQESMEGENPASFIYVTNGFLSPPQEQELRLFFFPFFKKLGVVNKGTEPSAGFPHQEGMCSTKGGHFDKSCELRWVQGNFLAHLGLPELLPQRAVSSPPGSLGERDSLHRSSWVGRRAPWGAARGPEPILFQSFRPPTAGPLPFPWWGLPADWPPWMLCARTPGGCGGSVCSGEPRPSGDDVSE